MHSAIVKSDTVSAANSMSISPPANNFVPLEKRLQVEHLLSPKQATDLDDGSDVIRGLTHPQKHLPPRYFYDDRGSQLFEQICELPEYYPTRTERAILAKHALEIAQQTRKSELVELGSGSSTKTRLLLDAHQELQYPLRYLPIDVSASILEASAKQLLADYPALQIHGLVSTYDLAWQHLTPSPLQTRTVLFLGSTLGNFSPSECDRFFSQMVSALSPGDYFLLGVDLQKPKDILEAAYNDSQGITAAFNLNMLQHLNWRFDGDFNLSLFKHSAFYNESKAQIEMHLVCQKTHSVRLLALDLTVEFEQGETILTEISRKFDWQKLQTYLHTQGFKPILGWKDAEFPFGVLLTQLDNKSRQT